MKRILVLPIILSLLLVTADGQDKPHDSTGLSRNFFLTFSVGPSFPVGSFAYHDVNNTKSGFANTGYNLNLDFIYRISPYVILDVSFLYGRYDINKTDVEQIGFSSGYWSYYGVVIGPRYQLSFGKSSIASIKALLGVTSVHAPGFSYTNNTILSQSNSTSLAMQFGLDYRYGIGKKMFVMVNLDYTAMNPIVQYQSGNNSSNSESMQQIDVLNLMAGIGINF